MFKLKLKSFFYTAILLTIFALSGYVGTAKAQAGKWQFKQVYVFSHLNSNAAIVGETYNAAGGRIDINANGKIYDLCPGGMEKMRFEWKFEFPVTTANPGGAFGLNLSASQLSVSEPCRDAISSQSIMAVYGSSGSISPFSEEFNRSIDASRFDTGNGFRVRPTDAAKTGIANVIMKDYKVADGHRYAYFYVEIGVRGSGFIDYVYLFERVG